MTALRDVYIEALIGNVKQGALDAELLDRIERLLTIEHGATATAPPTETPSSELEPTPPHEEPQETGIAARPPLDALSAPDKESPAPSPDRKHSPLIGLQPTVKHEDPEQEPDAEISTPHQVAEEGSLASDPPAPASPEPKSDPSGDTLDAQRQGWTPEKRQAASDRAKASWAARRATKSGEAPPVTEGVPPVVSVHVSPVASDETIEAIASVAAKAVAAIESGEITRVVKVKSGAVVELPPCGCVHQFAVSGPGHWHDKACPRHTHKFVLPPAAGLDGERYEVTCQGADCDELKVYDPGESMYNGHPVQSKKHSAAVSA